MSVSFVSSVLNDKCRELETKFAKLTPMSGVLFVSVSGIPSEKGGDTMSITLGVSRTITKEAGMALVESMIVKELGDKYKASVMVVRGVSGPTIELDKTNC